jgi:hypothetical protein
MTYEFADDNDSFVFGLAADHANPGLCRFHLAHRLCLIITPIMNEIL